MYGLSLGVSRIGDELPAPVYALLSGLNAATVGIIALAAVQLAQKAITDRVTRMLVFLSGTVGILFTALWYFPVLMATAGLVTVVHDFKMLHKIFRFFRPPRNNSENGDGIDSDAIAIELATRASREPARVRSGGSMVQQQAGDDDAVSSPGPESSPARTAPPPTPVGILTWKTGLGVIMGYLVSFTTVMILRGALQSPPRTFLVFANLCLAGTIIFGGGPVVIPLLREYIVAEGWVSSRDFLLGLALVQSFPGPNFNFAVYLGSLAVLGIGVHTVVGAIVAFLGIFLPGMTIVYGFMGLWQLMRSRRWVISLLRGVNAAAVGLVYTAVYKLWQIGFVNAKSTGGMPLGSEPWFVAITATSFVGGAWFGLAAPFAILLGGVMGLLWYAATQR